DARPRRAGGRAVGDAARAGVPDPARRGDGDGHADHRPADVLDPGGRRPARPRHGPVPVPRGGDGGREGGAGGDGPRPGPARQARCGVATLSDLLDRNGALAPGAAAGGLAPLVDSVLGPHAAHLAMEPTPEAVAAVARDALRKLTDLGAVEPGLNPDRLRSGP